MNNIDQQDWDDCEAVLFETSPNENLIIHTTKRDLKEANTMSAFSKTDSKNMYKEKQIWEFIHTYIDSNLKLFLKTNGQFTDQESDKIIKKIQDGKKLSGMHRNTIKALPKIIKLIFLLKTRNIKTISGEKLLELTDMKGQHAKAQKIADHLNIPLPFINALAIEKILNSKKVEILNGEFFPSRKNLRELNRKIKDSKLTSKIVSRWLSRNTSFKNLTELDQKLFNKIDQPVKKEEKHVILDRDTSTHKAILRDICDTIIRENPDIRYYTDIQRKAGIKINETINKKYRRKILLSQFKKLQELYGREIDHIILSRRYHDTKWMFLWQDSRGDPISREQAISLASNYLLKDILKGDTSIYDLEHVNKKLGRNDFISQLSARGIKYNELLTQLGLELNYNPDRWQDLRWSSDGNPRTYEEALENATNHLKNFLSDYDFKTEGVPVQRYLIVKENERFLAALRRNNLDYYEVLKSAGYPDDRWRKKWWMFDKNDQGIPLTANEQKSLIYQYFKENIFPIYVKNNMIKDKLGPSYDEAVKILKSTEFHGFISAVNARGVSHGELLLVNGISPRITQNQRAGNAFHWIAENIFMKVTRHDNNCQSYYESEINEKNHIRPDNSIIIDDNFYKLSEFTKQIPSKIKIIHVDYYLIHSSKRTIYKASRGYQDENSMLISVPLNIKKSIETRRENVKILSVYDFCDFFGFSKERREEFIKYSRLALGSIKETDEGRDKLSILENASSSYENELKTNPKINYSIKKKKIID